VAVSSGYAYTADYPYGVRVYSVSTPRMPMLVGQVSVPWILSVAVFGSYAYASRDVCVQILDVSDRRHPRALGQIDAFSPVATFVAAARAYVVTYQNPGLVVADVSDPLHPRTLGRLALLDYPNDVVVDGEYAYVACESADLVVVDVSDPTDLRMVGSLDPDDGRAYTVGVAISDGMVFTVRDLFNPGLDILPMQCGAPTALQPTGRQGSGPALRACFAYGATAGRPDISLDLPTSGQIHLTVYDIGGRRLRTLLEGPMEAGSHHLTWDRCDDAGRMVAAGVYLIRASSEIGATTARVVLLK
jgi:hypothetical protein